MIFQNNQKGVAVLLALLVLSGILIIALGVAGLKINRMKLSRNVSDSVVAYYAAEAGIERALFRNRKKLEPLPIPGNWFNSGDDPLSNGASYNVKVISQSGPVTIKSIGSFGAAGKKTKRSVEINY